MRGRLYEIALGYWQGPQAQEKDNEIYGKGASYYYKYRQQDARLGRFWSVDPLARKYPRNSPYAFAMNRLVDVVEWEGLEIRRSPVVYDKASAKYIVTYFLWVKVNRGSMKEEEVKRVLSGVEEMFSSQEAAGTKEDPWIRFRVITSDEATIRLNFVETLIRSGLIKGI